MNRTRYVFRACHSKKVRCYHLHLAETRRQAEEQESFIVNTEEASGVPSLEVVGMAAGGPTKRGACSVIGLGEHISLSLIGPEFEVGTKYKEADQSWTSHSWTGCSKGGLASVCSN